MLSKVEIEHLIDYSYRIRLSLLKSMTKSGTGFFGACLAMTDIFTALYFNPLNQSSNELKAGNKVKVILIADHLKPLLHASQAHAGLIPLKALYPSLSIALNQDRTITSKKNMLLQTLNLDRSYKSSNCKPKVFIIIGIEELFTNENLHMLIAENCSIQENETFILDQSSLILNQNDITSNKILTIKEKLTACGWNSRECDGHNFSDLCCIFDTEGTDTGTPHMILPNTISGKGIISIEDDPDWYNKVPSTNETREFCCQLEESFRITKIRLKTYKSSQNKPEG